MSAFSIFIKALCCRFESVSHTNSHKMAFGNVRRRDKKPFFLSFIIIILHSIHRHYYWHTSFSVYSNWFVRKWTNRPVRFCYAYLRINFIESQEIDDWQHKEETRIFLPAHNMKVIIQSLQFWNVNDLMTFVWSSFGPQFMCSSQMMWNSFIFFYLFIDAKTFRLINLQSRCAYTDVNASHCFRKIWGM